MQQVTINPVDAFNNATGEFIASVDETLVKHAANGGPNQYILNHPIYHLMTLQQRTYYVQCVSSQAVVKACRNVRETVEEEGILAAGPWGP